MTKLNMHYDILFGIFGNLDGELQEINGPSVFKCNNFIPFIILFNEALCYP